MINSFSMILISCLFMSILMLYFLSKRHVESPELKLYKELLICNFIGLIFEMLCIFTIYKFPENSLPTIIINKLYLLYFILFPTIFTVYVYLVSHGNDEFKKIYGKYNKYIYAYMLIIGILDLYLPIEINYSPVAYSYGKPVNLIYINSFMNIIICIVLMIKNIKAVKSKKYVPLVVYLIGSGIVGFIQKIHPELTLSTTMDALVLFIMFFTVENPDMRLLEELHKSKEVSDNANEEKTLFLYNMTQEIRNVTKKIDDDADIILDSKDWEETYDSARDIKSNTSRFTNMTNEILDVGSIDETNLKIYNSKYSIKNIIKQLVNVYGDICKNKELKFITNIDHDIPETLYGDSINLKEVLNTILDNSIKYTEKGFIEFDVNTIIKNDICRLIFTIEDSGIGIKSDNINKIKLENKSLAKANQLITVMNGTMLISSDYGVGTKVKIILDQKIEISEDKVTTKYESSLEKVEVLAIDDSEAGLKILDKLLKDTNIILDKSNNGKDSLEKIRVSKYDLILLDEELSSISGKELLEKIKEIRNFNTPVILLTKDNNYEYNEEYKNEGFTDYILKPLKKNTLLEIINKYTKKDK